MICFNAVVPRSPLRVSRDEFICSALSKYKWNVYFAVVTNPLILQLGPGGSLHPSLWSAHIFQIKFPSIPTSLSINVALYILVYSIHMPWHFVLHQMKVSRQGHKSRERKKWERTMHGKNQLPSADLTRAHALLPLSTRILLWQAKHPSSYRTTKNTTQNEKQTRKTTNPKKKAFSFSLVGYWRMEVVRPG